LTCGYTVCNDIVLLTFKELFNIDISTWWWIATGVLVAVELLTGTFYILMVALGSVAAAVSSTFNTPLAWQFFIAAIVGSTAVIAWRKFNLIVPQSKPANANKDVNMDIGQSVQVENWQADGTAKVLYRGASWDVALKEGQFPASGVFVISEIVGSCMILEKPSQA